MSIHEILRTNVNQLKENDYPGRGIILGITPSRSYYVQVYWIMGRSENSRNRIFEVEGEFVKNKAYDESKMIDPSLIIYYPLKKINHIHIVSNGDHTETMMNGINIGGTFESTLYTREYEPDAPHFTPRISGIIDTVNRNYKLSILKSSQNRPEICVRNFYNYSEFAAGEGHCIHTYSREVNETLLSYVGEPFEVPLMEDIEEVKSYYWNLLNPQNRISLLVKFIDITTSKTTISLINKNV